MNLADVYSYLESLRRGTKGLLANPTDTLNQWGSQIKEDLGKYDQGNARTMGLLSDPVLGGGSAPGAAAWQNNGPLGMNAGLLGLHTAYHGTPHEIPFGWGFDANKIGTGEGAQAFGHGLYFAENPSVARNYAHPGDNYYNSVNQELSRLASEMDKHTGGEYGKFTSPEGYALKARYDELMHERANKSGNVYQVDINADPAHYLDWDKPLSEQSQHVQDAIARINDPMLADQRAKGLFPAIDGGNLFYQLANKYGGNKVASAKLLDTGLPGIKYKDAGSRAADGGTHNYVVFDDSLINNLGPQP